MSFSFESSTSSGGGGGGDSGGGADAFESPSPASSVVLICILRSASYLPADDWRVDPDAGRGCSQRPACFIQGVEVILTLSGWLLLEVIILRGAPRIIYYFMAARRTDGYVQPEVFRYGISSDLTRGIISPVPMILQLRNDLRFDIDIEMLSFYQAGMVWYMIGPTGNVLLSWCCLSCPAFVWD